ncbi:MAG: hypothetical protein DMG95_12485 [Acidobacteria bacterium]|nr:MAG: hypothetical protein DMG95_12485 [Acidobacteriota bacterium]
MKLLGVLCAICGCCLSAAALDREAFTFTRYDLEVRIEPEQQRLGVRGKVTLRNDSEAAQANATLQISSTLNWSSIRLEGKPIEFISQTYTSDVDHTGALTEAIIAYRLGRNWPVVYCSAWNWQCGVVSDCNRGGKLVTGE